MAKEKSLVKDAIEVNGLTLLNSVKVERAKVKLDKAFGEGNWSTDQLLAEYDKLGGAIKKVDENGNLRKVALGSFWDFVEKKAKTNVRFEDLDFQDEYVLVRKPVQKKVPTTVENLRNNLSKLAREENVVVDEETDAPTSGRGRKKSK